MPRSFASRDFLFPAPQTWEAIDAFGDIYRFHPLVRYSETTNGQPTGLGAERTCTFERGPVHERIVGYEPGRSMTVRIVDPGPFPLKSADATLTVESLGPSSSRVTMTMDFEPKFGLLGRVMGPAMRARFTRVLDGVLEGLGDHLHDSAPTDAHPVQSVAST